VPIGISCDSDIDKARAILLVLARRHPLTQEVAGCPVTQFGPTGVVLTLGAWCSDSAAASTVKGDLLEQVAKRFAAEGLKLPFPQTTVTLIQAEAPPPASPSSSPS
jgi:small-conductance mechanosensitive channel